MLSQWSVYTLALYTGLRWSLNLYVSNDPVTAVIICYSNFIYIIYNVSNIVESLSALPRCLQKFLRFPRFFAPGYSFWRRTRIHRDPGLKIFFRRAVHVQSFQSPCTCTARPVLPSEFTPFDRANQELQNAFLDESLAQKEPKLWPWKVGTLFTIFVFCMPNISIRDNRFENNAKFVKTSKL